MIFSEWWMVGKPHNSGSQVMGQLFLTTVKKKWTDCRIQVLLKKIPVWFCCLISSWCQTDIYEIESLFRQVLNASLNNSQLNENSYGLVEELAADPTWMFSLSFFHFKKSLPMFTVLRKFTIPLTLLLEVIILGWVFASHFWNTSAV